MISKKLMHCRLNSSSIPPQSVSVSLCSLRSGVRSRLRQGKGKSKSKGKALYDTRSHGSDDMTGTELEATRADARIHILISHSHRKVKSRRRYQLDYHPCHASNG